MSYRRNYYSYLLRLWSAQEQGQIRWRAMVEDPRTREQIAFSSLQRLFTFLEDQTEIDGADLDLPEPKGETDDS